MTKKISLTPSAIEALRTGKIADQLTPGLSIEALPSGRKVWKYRRRIAGGSGVLNERLGFFGAHTIADARAWARDLNDRAETGVDPKAEAREAERIALLTVDHCFDLYMQAVRLNQHKTTRTKRARPLKPRTISVKQEMYDRNVKPVVGSRSIHSIKQKDLVNLIIKVGDRGAKTQANRTGAELRVFFNWACSLRGKAKGIELDTNPAAVLGELWIPEEPRTRWLDYDELPLFLRALACEDRLHRRALLLVLLTGCRFREVMEAPASEIRDGLWTIPGARTKNGQEHPIALGAWGRHLACTNSKWLIPSPKQVDAGMVSGWSPILARIRKRMSELAGRDIEHFVIHDLRRTMRSHVEDHGIDELTAEKMINHLPIGLVKIYNRNKRAAAMSAGFANWDAGLAEMAIQAGVGEALEIVTTVVALQSTP